MNDKQKSLFFPVDPKNQDLPANSELALLKEKLKRRTDPTAAPGSETGGQAAAAARHEEPDPINENLLADIRRSLAEEEVPNQGKKKRGLFREVGKFINSGRSSQAADPKEEGSKPDAGIDQLQPADDPSTTEGSPAVFQEQAGETPHATIGQEAADPSPYPEPDILIPKPVEGELLVRPDLNENIKDKVEPDKKDIWSRSKDALTRQGFDDIREMVLVDYDETEYPPEEISGTVWPDRLKDLTRGLTALDKMLISVIAVLLFIAGMFTLGVRIINAQTSAGSPATVEAVPYPVRIILPGGWDFKLATGRVVNGRWSPEGAEWLESTELCKWIAIPWTTQLEAVVRTLQPNDEIQLIMSNADELEFKVLSTENVPADQIGGLDRATPSLLLILVNKNVDTRWVVTALSE